MLNKLFLISVSVLSFVLINSCKKDSTGDDVKNPLSNGTFHLKWKKLPEFTLNHPEVPYGEHIKSITSTAYASNNMYAIMLGKFNVYRLIRFPATEDTIHVVNLPFIPHMGAVFNCDNNSVLISYSEGNTIKFCKYSESGGVTPLPNLPHPIREKHVLTCDQGVIYAFVNNAHAWSDSSYVYQLNGTQWNMMGSHAFGKRLPYYMNVKAAGGRVVAFGFNPKDVLGGCYYLKQWNGTQWVPMTLPSNLDTSNLLVQHYMAMNATGTLLALNQSAYDNQTSKVFIYNFNTASWSEHSVTNTNPIQKLQLKHITFDHAIPDRLYAATELRANQVSQFSIKDIKYLQNGSWSTFTWSDSSDIHATSVHASDLDFFGYHPRGNKIYSVASSYSTGRGYGFVADF